MALWTASTSATPLSAFVAGALCLARASPDVEATGAPLAAIRIPQIVHAFVGDGLAAIALEKELGVPRVELLRLRLIDD